MMLSSESGSSHLQSDLLASKAFVGNWVVCAQLIQVLIMGDRAWGTGNQTMFDNLSISF